VQLVGIRHNKYVTYFFQESWVFRRILKRILKNGREDRGFPSPGTGEEKLVNSCKGSNKKLDVIQSF